MTLCIGRSRTRFALLLSIGISVLARGQAGRDESLTLTAEKSIVNAGDDIRVVATLTNTSQHTIDESRKRDGTISCLDLTVRDEQGSVVKMRPPDHSACQGRSGCEILQMSLGNDVSQLLRPGQSAKNVFKVSELYDLSTPGHYYLQATCGKLNSDVITLTVQGKSD